ncbi:hypothetical protein HPP92_006811 [Vanilla planifolia]|uniref:Uncharacterized protein n=1 Tax=Vanilla planifolia TaxID=51239 RepID=A0A835R9B5_VANPL|nr:hypothetical protein HPP92_006811 [Vanilla planifolia]
MYGSLIKWQVEELFSNPHHLAHHVASHAVVNHLHAGIADGFLAPASSVEANSTPADELSAFTSLYSASPYYQFAHFTANLP